MISLLYRLADRVRRRVRGAASIDCGRLGEDLAHRFLRRQGCTVVARNFRPRSGGVEIDLIAWQGPALLFVEVKTRATGDFGPPDRAVDLEKQIYVIRAARDYTRRAGIEWNQVRFDIIGVTLGHSPRIDWIEDAFRD